VNEGPVHAPRALLVPGFTQTGASWSAVVDALDADAAVVEVPRRESFADTAAALGDAGGHGVWVGYSMGGRLALRLALDRPGLVRTLVLVSASPGIAEPDERAARRAADDDLARAAVRDGAEAFLARWLAQPMFAGVPPDAPGIAERRSLDGERLAHDLRVLGTGAMEPLWDRLAELTAPVWVVTGTADAKFDEIGARTADAIPGARHVRIAGGHALPLEAPTALAAVVDDAVRAAANR
jgi:2-succinyl-6-hydroxy-2,4-cyclohexadiene-1-carboxylate synthase